MKANYAPSRVSILAAIASVLISVAHAEAQTSVWCVVDDHVRPLPGAPPGGWFYNQVGGDRGLLCDVATDPNGVAAYSQPANSVYRAEIVVQSGLWGYLGMWYALGRPISDKPTLEPSALFHPVILSAYQPRLTGLDVIVGNIESPGGRSDLEFRIELKGFNEQGYEVLRWYQRWTGRESLIAGPFPKTFSMDIDPDSLGGNVGVVLWLLDRAVLGDAIEVDAVRLRVEMPELPTADEAFLVSLAMLLHNYDDRTGMVQDRSNFPRGDFENVTATAKLAKILAMAIEMGFVEEAGAKTIIAKIADTLLNTVPRGPTGINSLWPHFTRNGGTERIPDSEWASGDTGYAILDLIVALQMIGDPQGQLAQATAMLQQIDWAALQAPNGGFYLGYTADGSLLPGIWHGFGTETLGVILAALAGNSVLGEMGPPPSDNGSGFIYHAGYPVVPAGVDRWGNNWFALRLAETELQLGWYGDPDHANPYLLAWGLFGLSAAERPEGWDADPARIYQAYGTGGRYAAANDGSNRVVVLHYSGMIAQMQQGAAEAMWLSLKQLGIVSPLNNLESMAVNPTSSEIECVNYLQGSWNLALQAEGWALCRPEAADALQSAVGAVPVLTDAYSVLFPAEGPTDAEINDFIMHSGVNLPWIRYGWDLGVNPWGGPPGGFASNREALEDDFAYLKTNHVKMCRVFLFCDFRTGLEFDGEGNILGVDEYVFDDMRALVDVAAENRIRLIPVLMDRTVADGVEWEGPNEVGEHPDFITNAVRRAQLIDNVIRPFVREFGTNDVIWAWDIINEPRLAWAVTQPDMRTFVEGCASAITNEVPGARVCFGSYDRYHLDEYGNAACNLTQVHHYNHMTNYWRFDTPAPEIYAGPVFFGETEPVDVQQKMSTAASNQYTAVYFWSLNGDDGYDFSAVSTDYREWVWSAFSHVNRDLAIEEVAAADGAIHLCVSPTYSGNTYEVSHCTNLLTQEWHPLQQFTGASGTNATAISMPDDFGPTVFLRVKALL